MYIYLVACSTMIVILLVALIIFTTKYYTLDQLMKAILGENSYNDTLKRLKRKSLSERPEIVNSQEEIFSWFKKIFDNSQDNLFFHEYSVILEMSSKWQKFKKEDKHYFSLDESFYKLENLFIIQNRKLETLASSKSADFDEIKKIVCIISDISEQMKALMLTDESFSENHTIII